MAGTASSDSMGWALSVDVVLLPKRVEKTPRGTDCLAVVAGVNGCGSAFDSAVPGPCCPQLLGGEELCGRDGDWNGTRASFEITADPTIVGFTSELQVGALQGRYATPSELLCGLR